MASTCTSKSSQDVALLQALVGHCEAWRANFTGLLNSIALRELRALHEYFESNTAALRRPPSNLDTLAEAVQLHRKLTLDKPAIQARFDPLHDKYRTLEKFEVRPKRITPTLMWSLGFGVVNDCMVKLYYT